MLKGSHQIRNPKINTLEHVLEPADLKDARKENEILSAKFFGDFFETCGQFEDKIGGYRPSLVFP